MTTLIFFDDAACVRSIPFGIAFAGKPELAAEKTVVDAEVTNSEDGLWAARAMAAATAVVAAGGSCDEVLNEALSLLPRKSWIRRKVTEALSLVRRRSIFAAIPLLADRVTGSIYSYGTAAPETLALTLAIYSKSKEDYIKGIMAANCIARTADSVPALVGALSTGLAGGENIPDSWLNSINKLRGICIPSLKDTDYIEIINDLIEIVKSMD